MSNIDLAIGGRRYTVACANGEEEHVAELGRIVDATVTSGGLRQQSEARMLLFASLMLADELHEARVALAAATPAPGQVSTVEIEERVDRIAHRLEALAQLLEHQHLEDQASTT
jgi:cell division protein ZapA